MRISVQVFVFALLLLLAMAFVGIWSVSLYILFGMHPALASEHSGFTSFLLEQLFWLVPLTVVLILFVYLLLYAGLIRPLLKLSRNMQSVVAARHPGNSDNVRDLAPGLYMLERYFRLLTDLATHDPLTGLNNRVIFEDRVKQALLEARRSGRKYILVFIDIDRFHRINDEYGHFIADGLLRQLAKRLTNSLRESDILARLEKDDFALLLAFSDDEQITSLLGKIVKYLTRKYRIYGRTIRISISCGAAVYPDHGLDIEDLSLKADQALIQAQKGGDALVFFQRSPDETDYSGYSRIQALTQALDRDEFKLVFQPVIDLRTHQTSYFEALLRWKDPDAHDLSIPQTIHIAERNRLIKPLTNWIIEHACRHLQEVDRPGLRIAVNLSMVDLHDEDLPERVRFSLTRWRVNPNALQIEITEGQIMQEPDQVIDILTRLTEMGICLSIDDFGTGQASLTYLRRLPVEKLKIDQSFVKDMVSNAEDRAIVEATISLAHKLKIQVVAEGVESAAIHDLLLEMGCDYAQGFYISRPIDSDQIHHWCEHRPSPVTS